MDQRSTTTVRREILDVLARLRRGIRRYVLLEGLALLVALLGGLFWLTLSLDWAYFQLSHLELPRWFRFLALVGAISLTVLAAASWLVLRMLRKLHARALAMVLERRFPELDDRLITAVEAAEDEASQPALTVLMRNRTIAEAARLVQQLELRQVFNQRPLQRAALVALVACISVATLAVADAGTMRRWYAGFVELRPSYWDRETMLSLHVLSPDEELRDFTGNTYLHPRGADLTLVVQTVEGKKVPDRVRLDYRLVETRGFGRVFLTGSDDRPFQHTLPNLLDSIDVWITGGDYTNAEPFRIEVVDPPRVDRVDLDVRYPAYTGLNRDAETPSRVPVLGTQTSLPIETRFELLGTPSKPLRRFRLELESGDRRLELLHGAPSSTGDAGNVVTQLRWRDSATDAEQQLEVPPDVAERLLSDDGRLVSVPFHLQSSSGFTFSQALSELSASGVDQWRIPYPADGSLKISLVDQRDIPSTEPSRFSIMGIADEPPGVETSLRGISNQITRKATIPIAGRLTDDYGIVAAEFEYRLDDSDEWQSAPLDPPFPTGEREGDLGNATDGVVRFPVLPLNLSLGQQLRLAVTATDGDNLNGPHTTRGQVYTFEIVSNEELMSNLYAKELNQRRRFTQNLEELTSTRDDLQTHRERIGETGDLDSQESAALETAIERGLHTLRKDASELESIHVAFAEIRDEMINNAVDTPQLLDRLEGKILTPLSRITEFSLPRADEQMGVLQLVHDQAGDPRPELEKSIAAITEVLDEMEQILLEMRKLETFQEAIELLKAIIAEEEDLMEEVRVRRRREAIERLQLD